MTAVRELLARADERLTAAGVETGRVDAELLLAALLGVPRTRLVTIGDVPDAVASTFTEDVARRAERVPLQHLVGTAPFRHLELAVGPGVFVPRPETELLVDAVLPHLRGLPALPAPTVVDLCAGSGALAVAIADEVPGARVVAVEKSFAALSWLRAQHRGDDGSGWSPATCATRRCWRRYTAPPTRSSATRRTCPVGTPVAPEVRADPPEAVFAGPDGLGLVPAVLARAAALLRPGGRLAVEHDETHGRRGHRAAARRRRLGGGRAITTI